MRMKRLPIQQRSILRWLVMLPDFASRNQFQLGDSCAAAIQPIAQYRVTDVSQMNPYLVCSPRFGTHAKERKSSEAFNNIEHRNGRPSVWVLATNCFLLPLGRVIADRLIYYILIAIGHS